MSLFNDTIYVGAVGVITLRVLTTIGPPLDHHSTDHKCSVSQLLRGVWSCVAVSVGLTGSGLYPSTLILHISLFSNLQ